MSIKRRLKAMERHAQIDDVLIVFFRTVFEAKDGGIESEVWSASIGSGPFSGVYAKRKDDEPFDIFQARMYAISRGEVGCEDEVGASYRKAPLSPVISMNNNSFEVESASENEAKHER